ncbi:unnamed protein product, partial [Allacma fusca]
TKNKTHALPISHALFILFIVCLVIRRIFLMCLKLPNSSQDAKKAINFNVKFLVGGITGRVEKENGKNGKINAEVKQEETPSKVTKRSRLEKPDGSKKISRHETW